MKKRIRLWVKISIILLFIIIIIIIYGHYICPKIIDINKYNITNNNIPNNFNNIKIVQVSDIHYKTTIKRKELKNLINTINNLKPDIVILNGDILDNSINYSKKDKETLINYLSKIDSNLGNYIIKGDNDTSDIWLEIVNSSNLIQMENTCKLIYNNYENPILLCGIDTNIDDTKINEINNYILNEGKNINYKILMLHEPDYIKRININNFNLVLGGHSLGGIINIPIIQNIFLPTNSKNYYKSYYKIDKTDFYISNGVGTNNLKFRLFNNPSINLYTLKNKYD